MSAVYRNLREGANPAKPGAMLTLLRDVSMAPGYLSMAENGVLYRVDSGGKTLPDTEALLADFHGVHFLVQRRLSLLSVA